ncbi:MAG: hypothetical protein KC933_36065 [Myxococcales bacterium]|nr:hypothetical protein [Myxococcales bacterium]
MAKATLRTLMLSCFAPGLLLAALGPLDAHAAPPKRVAILYFDNNTKDGDLDLLRKGMADMLITDLSGVEGMTVVEREKLEALLAELKLQRSKYFDAKTAVKLGRGAGATHAVTGAFNALGGELRIDVRMVEVGTQKVVATEKVVGKKSDFFELEQRLAVAFACSLAGQRCKQEAPAGKGPDLEMVRRYAQGLDLADSGDLKEASRALQSVVSAAPGFAPAKATYKRVMKQLYSARASRTDKLSEARARLEARVAEVLRNDALARATADDASVGRWVAYRVLAGQLILQSLDGELRALSDAGDKLEGAALARFTDRVTAYADHQERLAKDLEAFLERNPGADLPDPELDEADANAGKELGLGDEPGILSFYSVIQLRRDLGTFLTTGAPPFWGTFRFSTDIPLYTARRVDSGVRVKGVVEYRTVRYPPVERLHGKLGQRALHQFETALARAEKLEDAEARQRQSIDTLEAWAQGLMAMGRPEEAIARWQQVLERFPKYEEYDRVEGLIRAALGD